MEIKVGSHIVQYSAIVYIVKTLQCRFQQKMWLEKNYQVLYDIAMKIGISHEFIDRSRVKIKQYINVIYFYSLKIFTAIIFHLKFFFQHIQIDIW